MSIIFKIGYDSKWYFTLITDLNENEKKIFNTIKYVDSEGHNIRYCQDIEKLTLLMNKFFKVKNMENLSYRLKEGD
jgi:hypothetical protein